MPRNVLQLLCAAVLLAAFPILALDIVTTVAGNGANIEYSDGVAATSATLVGLDEEGGNGLAVDGSGNIFFADAILNKIRRVDGATGIISTIAGTGVAGYT